MGRRADACRPHTGGRARAHLSLHVPGRPEPTAGRGRRSRRPRTRPAAAALHLSARSENLRLGRGPGPDDGGRVCQGFAGARGRADPDPGADGEERQHERSARQRLRLEQVPEHGQVAPARADADRSGVHG